MIPEIEKRINEYSAKVLSGNPPSPQGGCPRCLGLADRYKLYDCRSRSFRYIVDNLVQVVQSYLLRWKCPLCKKPFTVYPDFAIPYKRYVADDFERMSSAYVNESSQTYQKVVIHKDGGYSYEQEKEPGKERQLNKTTVWRWVGYLGRKAQELKDAMEVICQRASNHFAMSRPLIIPQRKYRSKCRKHLLESAGLLLRINRIWTELSGRTIFPRLATPASNFYYILSAMG